MRTVTQNPNPPSCLSSQPPRQDWYTFMQRECHGLVAESVREEQHRLCCYCETEIEQADCHVEHLAPRSASPATTYTYANLAASCNGNGGQHCGHFKDDNHRDPDCRYDRMLFCSPHDPATKRLFAYALDGKINPPEELSPLDREKSEYMIGYLGLGDPGLEKRRHAHALALIHTLGKAPDPSLLAWAMDYYLKQDGQNRLRQFHSLSTTLLT